MTEEEKNIDIESDPISTIEVIKDIKEIKNADMIEIAIVLGWECIIRKGSFSIGDKIIFIRPDAILNIDIVKKYNIDYLKKNFRVRTVKLRGVYSQGLILPADEYLNFEVGHGMDKILNVYKYEPKDNENILSTNTNASKSKRTVSKIFDDFDVYTKIKNINNYPNIFNDPEEEIVVTEKIHGTNFRAGNLKYKVRYKIFGKLIDSILSILKINTSPVFGSHRVTFKNDKQKAYYSKNVYAEIFKRYNLDKIIPKGYVFYGEIYGSNIQKNYEYGLSNGEIDVVFFDIKHNNEYLPWDEFTKIINSLNLKHVPVIFKGKRKDIDFEKACVGKSILDPNTKVREGCVVKSIIETRDNTLGRRILKVINKKYLENKNNTEYH